MSTIDPDSVAAQSLSADDFVAIALANLERGYAPLPIGKRDKRGRFKAPWVSGYHGYERKRATPDEISAWPALVQSMIQDGTPGVLSLGLVLPPDVVGFDVDAYDGKPGHSTLKTWRQRWGKLPKTHIVTARFDGSGIRLYRKPVDWEAQEQQNSGVDFIDSNHRYVAAPPSYHHTGQRYRLRSPQGEEENSGVLPSCDVLPVLPKLYRDGLARATKAVRGPSVVLVDFIAAHTTASRPRTLGGVTSLYAKVYENAGEPHNAAKAALDMGFSDAAVGYLSAADVYDAVRTEWAKTRRPLKELEELAAWTATKAANQDRAITLAKATRDYGTDTRKEQQNMSDQVIWVDGKAYPYPSDDDADPSTTDDDHRTEPTQAEVSKQLLRLNTTAEAKRLQSLGAWTEPQDQGDALHQYQNRPPAPDWLIKELIPPGSRVLVNAQWKTGKTTLGVNLLHTLVTGRDFLRRFSLATKPLEAVAYWNHEVDQQTFLGWLHDRGLIDPDEPYGRRIFPLHTRDFTSQINFDNDAAVEWAVNWLKERRIEAWFIDTLSRLYTGSEKENDEITRWWQTMNEVAAKAGVKTVVIFHHTGYSEEAQERGRGASALMGLPDVLVSFRHNGKPGEFPPDNIRWLKAFGRNVHLDEVELDYAGDATRELFVTGSGNKRETPGLRDAAASVALYLHDTPGVGEVNQGNLCKALGLKTTGRSKEFTDEVLRTVVANQWVSRREQGKAILYKAGSIHPTRAV